MSRSDFDEVIIAEESCPGDFGGKCATREEFDAWERKALQRIEDRYGVRPRDSEICLVDLYREIELNRRAITRQHENCTRVQPPPAKSLRSTTRRPRTDFGQLKIRLWLN